MNNLYYILENRKPKVVNNVVVWAKWFETANRIVKQTTLPEGIRISTVFLGLDHGYEDTPILFETMIFGGEHDGDQWRYATWEEAEKGHEEAVNSIFEVNQ